MKLSETQGSTTVEERERTKVVPYALAIFSVMYSMLCTKPNVCLAKSLARGYKVIQEWTTGHRSKLSLGALKRTKKMFLGYGGDKEFVVKSYIGTSFDTDLDDSKSQSRYVLNVGAIS